MKNSAMQTTKQNKQTNSKIPKPEIRDDLDSRENEEQQVKGSDITHNKKETRNNKQRKKDS